MGRAKSVSFHQLVTKSREKKVMDGGAGEDSGQGSDGPGDGSFGGYLLAAARSIIADARQSIADEKLTDAEAVHDVRKALKRWRALMRLLSEPLGAARQSG